MEKVILRLTPAVKFLFPELCPKLIIVKLVSCKLLKVRVPPPLTVTTVTFIPVGKMI